MVTADQLAAQFNRLARMVCAGDHRASRAMVRLETVLDDYISGVH
jgi:hypothetical protein